MPRLMLFEAFLNLIKELKSTTDGMGGCSKLGPHVAQKILTVIVSTVLLHHFISMTSIGSVTTQ